MKLLRLFVILAVLSLPACDSTFAVGIESSSTSTASLAPAATDTLTSSATPAPTAVSAATPEPETNTTNYMDDRSNPSQVIVSYYNAIDRQEYLRAYDYWTSPSNSLGDFTTFANGYKDTASVELVFGQITGDAGMSQVYYTVPVILKTISNTGAHNNWAACYVVHAAAP